MVVILYRDKRGRQPKWHVTKQFPALHSTHAQKGGVESQESKIDRGASNIPFNTVIMHGHKAEIGACTY